MAWHKYFSVEVPLMLSVFSQMLLNTIHTNLLVYRSCYIILGYKESECAQLGNEDNDITKQLEPLVQPTVNEIEMVYRVIGATVPIIFCMFVGTWSDNFGRKPFLILNLIGLSTTSIINIAIAYFPNVSPWYFVASNVPMTLTGGYSILFITITMYLADVSSPEDRALRLGIFEALQSVGVLLGSFIAPAIFYATSYVAVYGIAAGLTTISIFYTWLVIPESLNVPKKNLSLKEMAKITNVTEIIKKPFKKRKNNGRIFVLIFMFVFMLYYFASLGESTLRSLFLRNKLHWTLTDISYSNAFGSATFILGTMFGSTVLYKTLKFKETHLLLFGLTMLMSGNLLRGLAVNDYYIYGAFTLSAFGGLCPSMTRTLLSFIVGSADIGKVYAASSAFDSLSGTVASVIYPLIYNTTLNIDSGIFYFVNVGINAVQILIVLNVMRYKIPMSEEIMNEKANDNKEDGNRTKKKLSSDSNIFNGIKN